MKRQQGFTLIELMIVVAVIGVLSAIAVPQYQKYVAKSEAASALATLTGLKTNAEAYTIETGQFPDKGTANINTTLGTPTSAMGTITYEKGTSAGVGTITFAFNTSVSPSIQNSGIQLARSITGEWQCNGKKGLDAGVRPKGCSNDYQ